jgi:hypothetical protein
MLRICLSVEKLWKTYNICGKLMSIVPLNALETPLNPLESL